MTKTMPVEAEHPADAKMREEGEAECAKYGPAILAEHADELRALLTTYSDARAREQFDGLRDMFWGAWLPDAVKKGGK